MVATLMMKVAIVNRNGRQTRAKMDAEMNQNIARPKQSGE